MNAPLRTDQATLAAQAVTLHDLGKRFGARDVLQHVDLSIEQGSFVAIVGRSGCGKSTLLRLIAGLEQPDAGDLRVGARKVRMMFQDARLLPWKNVLGNVTLGIPREARAGGLNALRAVGLADRAGDWPTLLSGGQRQRVALARALARAPDLLLLDEPLGALDALTRIEMHALLESLWLEQRFTAVLVTHDVQEALVLADRVILIEQGRIALDQRIDLPRPRLRGSAAFAQLEELVLQRVLATSS